MKNHLIQTIFFCLAFSCLHLMIFRSGDHQGNQADNREPEMVPGRFQILDHPVTGDACSSEGRDMISCNPLLQHKQINFFIP